jgi:cell wall-associated NlpC family hydrolase
MVFGGLNLFGSMSSGAGDGTNKDESIKQIDNHDDHDDNKNKQQINNDETSSANNATANSDKLDGDAPALKNHNVECEQTKDSAPPSSPNSQQSKQDATTRINADERSSTVTVTTEATQQKPTSSESASPAGVVQDDKITGLGSVLKGVGTSCTVDYVVEKQRDNMLPSKTSAISNTSSTVCSSISDSTDTATTEEQPKKADSTQEQASKKTAPTENEESASAVDGVSQQMKNNKSAANQTPTTRQLRSSRGGTKKKSLLIEVIGINGLLEFRDVPADGNCMIHALNEVCPNLQKDPWKLRSEMVEFAAEGKLHGRMVLNQEQINTLQFQLASNNNSTFDVWAKDIVKKKNLTNGVATWN